MSNLSDPENIDITIKYNGMQKRIKMPLDYADLCKKSYKEFGINKDKNILSFYYLDEDDDKYDIGTETYLSNFVKFYEDNDNKLTIIIKTKEKEEKNEINEKKDEIIEITKKKEEIIEINEKKNEIIEIDEKKEEDEESNKLGESNKIEDSGMYNSKIDLADSCELSNTHNPLYDLGINNEEEETLNQKPTTEKNPEVSKEMSSKYGISKLSQSTVFKIPKKTELECYQENNSKAKKESEELKENNKVLKKKIEEIKAKIEKIKGGCTIDDKNKKNNELNKSDLKQKIEKVKEDKKKMEEEKNKKIEELKLNNENLSKLIDKKKEQLLKLKQDNKKKKIEQENLEKMNSDLNLKIECSSEFYKKGEESISNNNNKNLLGLEKEPSSIIHNETFISKQSEDEIQYILDYDNYDNNNDKKKNKKLERIKKISELMKSNKNINLNLSKQESDKIKKDEDNAKNKIRNSIINIRQSKIKNDNNDDNDIEEIKEQNNSLKFSISKAMNDILEAEKDLENIKKKFEEDFKKMNDNV